MVPAVPGRPRVFRDPSAAWQERLFPQQLGVENPLWTLILRGRDVPLSVYEQLDENLVRSLISAWSRAEDATLSGLVLDFKRRRLPKVIAVRREEMDGAELERLGEEVRAAFRRKRPALDPKYHVGVDKPSRKAYPDGAIYPSLIVPEDFRDEAASLVKEVRS